MATHLVTGYAGSEHIKSEDQGSFNASFFGTGQFVMEAGNMLEASIIDNNTVRILDGDLLMKGRHIRINPNTYEDVVIETGTAGVNRCDLIVMEYSKDATTGIEQAYIKVIKGTETTGAAAPPTYTAGDILAGATFNQMPLYKVMIEGVVLVDIECLFDTKPTYETLARTYEKEFMKACQTHLDSLGILDTMEEIEANTQDDQLAGAKAVKELGESLKSLIQDEEGYYYLSSNYVISALLTFAKKCKLGMTLIRTGSDLDISEGAPESKNNTGFVIKRGAAQGAIFLFSTAYRKVYYAFFDDSSTSLSFEKLTTTDDLTYKVGTKTTVQTLNVHLNSNNDLEVYKDGSNQYSSLIRNITNLEKIFLPLSGGTLSGSLNVDVSGTNKNALLELKSNARYVCLAADSAESGGNVGLYDLLKKQWIIYSAPDGTVKIPHTMHMNGGKVLTAANFTVSGTKLTINLD